MSDPISLSVKMEYLKKQACFSRLTDKEIESLATLLFEEHLTAGSTIVKQGAPVDKVYLIVNGTADVMLLTIENRQMNTTKVASLGPGQAIGLNETGFYSLSGIRTASVVAVTDMVLLSLSVASFHGFSLANPHVHKMMQAHADQVLEIKFDDKE